MAKKDSQNQIDIAYSGNKFSLRSRAQDQVKRINFVANTFHTISEFFSTTWGGIFKGIIMLGATGYLIAHAIIANSGHTLVQNIPSVILIAVGGLLLSLNLVLTNPSSGSQFMVSARFIWHKFRNRANSGHILDVRPFAFEEGNEYQDVIVTTHNNRLMYFTIYQVRGSVSPVSFPEELKALSMLDKEALGKIDRDTNFVTINAIKKSEIQKKPMPNNATEDMRKKREINYRTVKSLKRSQKLDTQVIIASYNPDTLHLRDEAIKKTFNSGLVIGYKKLRGNEAKKAIRKIYG